MTTDNKTLADVQPGGRVRLGDQAERARFEAWARTHHRLGESGYLEREQLSGDYRLQPTDYAWAAWQAALSAQPCLGGQGDARALIQRYDAAGAKFRESLMDDHYSDAQRVELRRELTAAQDELLTALATRQSVGEEPVAYMVRWKTEGGFGLEWPKNMQYFRDRADEYEIVPLQLAAPPAQAVDLTTVRYALDAAEGLAVACASVDGFSREELASAGREMRRQFADARALIDSQAVGK